MAPLYINIKNRRIELGLSQEDLARKMGYTSRSSIAKIESGKNDIPQSKIQAFAKALQTTPGYLMGYDTKEVIKEKQPTVSDELSESEKSLLELFRKIPENNQKFVIEMIRAALNTQE